MRADGVVREARRRAGLTQRELARRAGLPQPSVARIESGAVTPRAATIDRVLAACGVELELSRRLGTGIDRTSIRELLALTPTERLALAVDEAANVERLVGRARRR